jgi:single-strand DNA-binding protein
MSGETVITIIGNLTNDPELRFTPSGAAVANFTVAHPRTFDRQTQRVEGRRDSLHAVQRLARGGRERRRVPDPRHPRDRLRPPAQRTYDTKEGEKRTVVELEVDEVGPSLRYATTKVAKTQRGGAGRRLRRQPEPPGGRQGLRRPQGGSATVPRAEGRTDDPWATGPSGGGNAYAGAPEDPPF